MVHRGEILARRHHLVEDGLGDRFRRILGEVADAQSALPFDLAGGRLERAADERQQRGLARAVGADDRDALACFDAERDTFEDALGTEGDTHVAEADQGQARYCPVAPSRATMRRTMATDDAYVESMPKYERPRAPSVRACVYGVSDA